MAPTEPTDRRAPTADAPPVEVLDFLEKMAGGTAQRVRRCETHAAVVVIGPADVYKIKRPVRFAYLDFTTLEARERACRREIELNQPGAPQIYVGVRRITRDRDGALAFDGGGDVVDVVVHMRPFAEADVLVNRIVNGPLPAGVVTALARRIHEQHSTAAVADTSEASQRFAATVRTTAAGLGAVQGVLGPQAVAAYGAAAERDLARIAPLLDARGRAGFVRRCHGDLHCGNIVLIGSEPVLFDALEFDEALATIDTNYDLAFLLMDLDHRGACTNANLLLSHTLWLSGADSDLEGLAALPLFMAQRAAVRALVTAERAVQHPSGEGDHAREAAAARGYLDYACAMLDPGAPAVLVAVGGLSGTGKSTLAAGLAPGLGRPPGAVHLRSDLERKALAGVGETHRLGAETYTARSSAAVYDRLLHRAGLALGAGQAVIVDAVFASPGERADVARLASERGLAFVGLWLEAAPEVLRERVTARQGDASDATADVVDLQVARGTGTVDWLRIDATGAPAAVLEAARSALAGVVVTRPRGGG